MKNFWIAGCLALAPMSVSNADVSLSSLFTDHMVLQRDAKVPVWGAASPGEGVEVILGSQNASAVAAGDGSWRVDLVQLPTGGPYELSAASAKNKIVLHDVLVGDVWLCSGQSNMGFPVQDCANGKAEAAASDEPMIRLLSVPQRKSPKPETSLPPGTTWKACAPGSVAGFSGAAYFFGRELHAQLGVPIGLIHSSYGGTPAEAWTSREALNSNPQLKELADAQIALMERADRDQAKFPNDLAAWETQWQTGDPENAGLKAGWAAPDCDTADWKKVTLGITYENGLGVNSGGVFWFRKEINLPAAAAGKPFRMNLGWLAEQYHTVYFNGVEVETFGRQPPNYYTGGRAPLIPGDLVKEGRNVIAVRFVSASPKAGFFIAGRSMFLPVTDPDSVDNTWLAKIETRFPPLTPEALATRPKQNRQNAQLTATYLFNGMIYPLIPYAIKGAIWYQGENNTARAVEYRTLLPTLIRDWRARWGEGDFPFYIQQLVNYGDVSRGPSPSPWAELREAQMLTAKTEVNADIACGIEIGDALTIHPLNKQEVGRRLALVALSDLYGKPAESSGPRFASMSIDGDAIRLSFTHSDALQTTDGHAPTGFEIAGEDKKFLPATAKFAGAEIVLQNEKITRPVAVRYAWANNPTVNLVNGAKLPAFPFRTDAWELSTASVKWQPQ